jgi:AmmeMemoRadiSam system protein B
MPSPVPERPGLLIRDPFHYSDVTLIVPPQLVECLECFDGRQTELDLRERLVRAAGDLQVGDLQQHLTETLSASGFLHDAVFSELQEASHRSFAEAKVRQPAHAGSGYPAEEAELGATMTRYLNGGCRTRDDLIALAAPHVSPEGGWECYRAAYQLLGERYRDRTFVVLGTSHYGQPERFGLTRKAFVTPYGSAEVDQAAVDFLLARAPNAIVMEDYCHSIEHSIEFQVVFLQHVLGAGVRILPVLCGPFARSLSQGGAPEDDDDVRAFLDALGELGYRENHRLFWVLGIDMAHIGRRYGDRYPAYADRGEMADVALRDRARIGQALGGQAEAFWELVRPNHDDLKWCGSSPLYTFLKAVPDARGELLRYQQWNIDPQSVVSFAGIAFRKQDGHA